MKIIVLSFVFFLCLNFCDAQSGILDPSFGNNGIVTADLGSPRYYSSVGQQVLLDSIGSIYMVTESAGLVTITKKHPDGSTDVTYGNNGYSHSVQMYFGKSVLQNNGKIVIVGTSISSPQGERIYIIVRFNADGMIDKSFGESGVATLHYGGDEGASCVAIQTDGKIVVAGNIWNESTYFIGIARFDENGTIDTNFGTLGYTTTSIFGFDYSTSVVIENDGKIIVGGSALYRYDSTGVLDTTFNGTGSQPLPCLASAIAIQSDGKILVAGNSSYKDSVKLDFCLSRFNANGGLDTNFGEKGVQTTDFGGIDQLVATMIPLNNGKIVMGGFTTIDSVTNLALARYNNNGSIDTTFAANGLLVGNFDFSNYINSIVIRNDDTVTALGYKVSGDSILAVAYRYDANGNTDNTFDEDGMLVLPNNQGSTFYTSTATQTDGKVLASGYSWNGSNYDFAIVRYNLDGNLDLTFSGDGKQMTDLDSLDDKINAMAIQNDGKILVAGTAGDNFGLARYNTDGSLDTTFANDGMQITDFGSTDFVSSLAIQTDGKILAAGSIISRYNTDGSLDMSFHGDGKLPIDCNDMTIQKDGKIVIVRGADFINVNRYDTNGIPDSTFGVNGFVDVWWPIEYSVLFGESIAIQNDGKLVISGYFQNNYKGGPSIALLLTRVNEDGTIDETFNGGQPILAPGNGHSTSVVIQQDNKIITGGYSYNGTNDDFTLARFNMDGTLDNTFNGGILLTRISSASDRIASLAIKDNYLYAAGFGQYPGNFGVVARYLLAPENGPGASTFITAANGDWNDPNTWIGGIVPYSTSKVMVLHNVTITTNITCYSLNLETAAGYLILATGANLTITH